MSQERARGELGRLLDAGPDRVKALLAAVRGGRIDGGDGCGCIMAHLFAGGDGEYLPPVGRDAIGTTRWQMTAIEDLVGAARPGDVPATSPALALHRSAL